MDNRAAAGLRLDRKSSVQQFETFLHTHQAKAGALFHRLGVKADAGVANREMNLIQGSAQLHLKVPNSAVFRRIVKGFLQHAEKAERKVGGQRSRNIMILKVNQGVLLFPVLTAEAFHGGGNTEILQL